VVLDGNHPLSGMALQFVATIVGVRPATPAEIENGSAEDAASVIVRPVP
jgi:FKBP-type peptidyl-prolyl cis-trans isomerase 2